MVVVGLAVYLVLTQFGGGSKAAKADESVVTALPDGEVQEMASSKSEAFRGSVSTDEYFEMLGDARSRPGMTEDEISLVSDSLKAKRLPVRPAMTEKGSAVERVFGTGPGEARPEAGDVRSGPGMAHGSRTSDGGTRRPMTMEEKMEYDRKRAEMVRDMLTGGDETLRSAQGDKKGAQGDNGKGTEQEGDEILRFAQNDKRVALNDSDGIICCLDDDFEDAAVLYDGAKRPFKCMFVRDEKLKSGQRVMLRLLENYDLDGVHVAANTHLSAICKIGERLELQVRSLEMGSRIVPLALDAYDTDGMKGIYCPETSVAKNTKKASDDVISTAGQTFGGLVGDLASTVIRTGASIAKSASGEVAVSVVSGYEFYLVKSERR